VVLEQIVTHLANLANLVPTLISTPLLLHGLGIVTPIWAIFGAPTHLISSLTLERYVVLYYTYEAWSSPFVFTTVDVVFLATLLLVEGENCPSL
jgi:hypothetical protein